MINISCRIKFPLSNSLQETATLARAVSATRDCVRLGSLSLFAPETVTFTAAEIAETYVGKETSSGRVCGSFQWLPVRVVPVPFSATVQGEVIHPTHNGERVL